MSDVFFEKNHEQAPYKNVVRPKICGKTSLMSRLLADGGDITVNAVNIMAKRVENELGGNWFQNWYNTSPMR